MSTSDEDQGSGAEVGAQETETTEVTEQDDRADSVEASETDEDKASNEDVRPVADIFADRASAFKDRFKEERNLMSFSEYLEVLSHEPDAQVRDTARYIRDCFLHYGVAEVHRPYGVYNRFLLLMPFRSGKTPASGMKRSGGCLRPFERLRRPWSVNRLILLNGPMECKESLHQLRDARLGGLQ